MGHDYRYHAGSSNRMTSDDIDWWYDYGKFDGSRGRESAAVLIMLFDGKNQAETYLEGYYDSIMRKD